MAKLEASNNYNNGRPRVHQPLTFHLTKDEENDIVHGIAENDIATSSVDIEDNNSVTQKLLAPELLDQLIPLSKLSPAPSDWNFFPAPDIETIKLIAKSIYTQGQLSPALVWSQGDYYMVLGGHTRLGVLQMLSSWYPEDERFKTMKCHVYGETQITPDEAKYIIITNNLTQRAKESPSILIRSVVAAMELQKRINTRSWGVYSERSNEVVAKSFDISPRSVDRIYRLRNLIPELLTELDKKTISKGLALELSLLPTELQESFYAGDMAKREISSAQIALIRTAKTIDDLENIYNSKMFTLSIPKIKTNYDTRDFAKVALAAPYDEMEKVKSFLKDNIDNIGLTESSKAILLDLLGK